jgi:molybdenum cofactor cytidylyltransferase
MFDCIVPAAGASSRMGRLKPLLPFAGSTIIETAVVSALKAGCRVLLVVGHGAARVSAPFLSDSYRRSREGGRLLLIRNPRWERGLLGSIQAALPFVEREAFFVAHADMPFIGSGMYGVLAHCRAERLSSGPIPRGEAAVIAAHEGRRGHPALLPTAWISEMLALEPRGKMKDFLAGKTAILAEAGPGAVRDIDTPMDYRRALSVRP